MEYITAANITLSYIGAVCNVANISVFLLQDWRTNNVTLTLLSLSITDFLLLVSCLVFDGFSILQTALPTSSFDFIAVKYYIVAWIVTMFSDISSLTTVLVSLERCLCIITPLHVQSLFSVRRTLAALALVWFLVGLSYTVLFSTLTLQWRNNLSLNSSKLTVVLSNERMTVEMGHNIAHTVILPSFCELTVAIYTVVMMVGLQRSSNFQKKSTQLASKHQSNLSASSTKYKKLVVVVCSISAIFIACNTPTVLFIYCKYFIPGFSYGGVYSQVYMAAIYVVFLLFTVNASANFFVYCSLNRRFRDKLRDILRCTGSRPKMS
ncbi:hypothetical protein BsWGS_09888 [Bradybaena similaris]